MNCIYCGKKLPMVKKFTSEEFCSVAHRQAYHHEQEQLAVARLLEDQTRRKPARKQPTQEKAPAFAEYLSEQISPRTLASRPWHSEMELLVALRASEFESSSVLSPSGTRLADPEEISKLVAPSGVAGVEEAIAALSASQVQTTLSPVNRCHSSQTSSSDFSIRMDVELKLYFGQELPADPSFSPRELMTCPGAILPMSGLQPQQHFPLEAVDFARASGAQLPFDLSRCFSALIPETVDFPTAFGPERLHSTHLPAPLVTLSIVGMPDIGNAVEASSMWGAAELDHQPQERSVSALDVGLEGPVFAAFDAWIEGSQDLALGPRLLFDCESLGGIRPKDRPPVQPHAYLPNLLPGVQPASRVVGLPSPTIVCYAGSIQRLFSRPRPANPRSVRVESIDEFPQRVPSTLMPAQSRSAITILQRPKGRCQGFETLFAHPESFLRSISGNWAATESLFAFNEPLPAKGRIASVRRSSLSVVSNAFRASRQFSLKFQAISGSIDLRMCERIERKEITVLKPQTDLRILSARIAHSPFAALSPFSNSSYRVSWQAVQQRWHDAPNDLRWIALAVPLIIGLIWFADSPSAQIGAKGRIASMVPNVSGLLNASFKGDSIDELKQNIQRRAAVELSDDFRQGLGEWSGVGEWSKGWSYDPAGFIRPRKLALYTPSLGLEDYRFEFLGAIERKALSWVFRAADVKNYYAARLEVTRGGPLPTVELVRYSVIDGRIGSRKSIPLPIQARLDTIYRVRVDVRGSDFVTTIQGQVVDVFTDDRLPRGGVGFFSESGEDARLRWIEVSHQYDMLGRLCAYLVPYNVSNSNVRSAP